MEEEKKLDSKEENFIETRKSSAINVKDQDIDFRIPINLRPNNDLNEESTSNFFGGKMFGSWDHRQPLLPTQDIAIAPLCSPRDAGTTEIECMSSKLHLQIQTIKFEEKENSTRSALLPVWPRLF